MAVFPLSVTARRSRGSPKQEGIMHVKRILTAIYLALFLILSAHSVNAEIKTFIKEYTYQASEEDSRNSSRTVSLREVKRLLLEQLGTYLENITEVQNFHLTKDQIVTLTAGIVSTEIVSETWDGKVYWLKAKISADPKDVIKSIDTLRKDREKVKELEELRKRSEALFEENERLKKELLTEKGQKEQEVKQRYERNITNLTATEWFERGYSLGISGNQKDAVEAFNKSIELNPRLAVVYYNRGVAYHVLGNYQQAIKDLDMAIELNPLFSVAYSNRGIAHGELGNYQQAVKDFNKAIELNPRLAVAYYNRGNAYFNLGNHQQAIKNFNKAIELNPKDAEAYINRGAAYGNLGNYQRAVKDFSKAIELNHQLAEAYYNRGNAYGKLGNVQQVIKDFKIAARLGHKVAQDFLIKQGIAW